MKFIAHNHYNNNSDGPGDFDNPPGLFALSETPVNVTNAGVTIFLLQKYLKLEEKIKLLESLHRRLQENEGHGINLVTSSMSDCVITYELNPFYQAVKQIDESIVTLWVGSIRENPNADHIVKMSEIHGKSNPVVRLADPQAEDKKEPSGSWQSYETRLIEIYNAAMQEAVPEINSQPGLRRNLSYRAPRSTPHP